MKTFSVRSLDITSILHSNPKLAKICMTVEIEEILGYHISRKKTLKLRQRKRLRIACLSCPLSGPLSLSDLHLHGHFGDVTLGKPIVPKLLSNKRLKTREAVHRAGYTLPPFWWSSRYWRTTIMHRGVTGNLKYVYCPCESYKVERFGEKIVWNGWHDQLGSWVLYSND